ncbi:MAG: PAS domain S-box protein [Tenacibaculum sp.]|nr:PAS domain S-box protein [Tenacibaculum sp.]
MSILNKILNFGIADNLTLEEQTKTKLSNTILFILLGVSPLFVGIILYIDNAIFTKSIDFVSAVVLVFIIAVIASYNNFIKTSRHLLMVGSILGVFYFLMLLGPGVGLELTFLTLIAVSYIIMPSKQKFFPFLYSGICILATVIGFSKLSSYTLELNVTHRFWISISFSIYAILLLFIVLNFFNNNILKAKNIAEETAQKWEDLMENMAEGYKILDFDRTYVFVNKSLEKQSMRSREELLGKKFEDCWPGITETEMFKLICECLENRTTHKFEMDFQFPCGKKGWYDINIRPIKEGVLVLSNDITERKNNEAKLLERKEMFKNIFNNSMLGAHTYELRDDGEIYFTGHNKAADELLGIDNSQFINKRIDEAFPEIKKTDTINRFKSIIKNGESWNNASINYKDNNFKGSFENFNFRTTKGKMISMFHDISERLDNMHKLEKSERSLRQSEERYSKLFNQSMYPIWLTDTRGHIVQFNDAAHKLLGYTKDEFLGMHINEIDVLEQPHETRQKINQIEEGEVFKFETLHKTKNGEVLNIMIESIPMNIKDEKFIFSSLYNITPLRKTEVELKEALKVKNVLLKEVHHRVKNNLQTITSLLNQQKMTAYDTNVVDALNISISRIESIALIHQHIYKAENIETVNIKNYITELVGKLSENYNTDSKFIEQFIEVEEIYFDLDIMLPIAIVINELVSNSFKYAFKDQENGIIAIQMFKKEDKTHLNFSDNGIGFSENFDIEKTKTLGLLLIKSIIQRQLKGELAIKSTPGKGIEYRMEF